MTCVTGDDTGIVKIWDISKSSGATLKFSFGEQSRKRAVMGMCWHDSTTSSIAFSSNDGVISLLSLSERIITSTIKAGCVAGLPNAMSFVKGKLVVISKEGKVTSFNGDLTDAKSFDANGPLDAAHIHRKFGMIAMGGRENDLCVYDLASEQLDVPVFKAHNIRDHILDVPFPVFVTGTCIINPYVFATSTAYHQVRFYDRRASDRPVQEFEISREIERRPTTMLQWNANKFLIGEASGDVHLYDTRRGFASRAKLRGGVGSVRCMAKHPSGHQILGVTGLDRKARLYHVPTGKLLLSIYVKQKANCLLLDKRMPLADKVTSFSGIVNSKQPEKANTLGDAIWDDMDPVIDELDEKAEVDDEVTEKNRKARRTE
jgi:ribosome biogenesis protein NSA1